MTTSTLTHLQLDEACSVFLVIEPLVILKGGNLLIIEAIWRLATNDNCVALKPKRESAFPVMPGQSEAALVNVPLRCAGLAACKTPEALLMS